MTHRLFSILYILIFFLSSCQSQTTRQNIDSSQSVQTGINQKPNFNYIIELPEGWTSRDTILNDEVNMRMLFPPKSLIKDYPAGNVIIASMNGQNINDFVISNMNYLKSNMADITILEKGQIDSTSYNGQWFTYTRQQNGITRDMINYIIPLNGFAYSLTCGTNKGSMNKYRETFDKIAKSFKG